MSFVGADGNPCLNKDGVAGWEATFDQRGNETSRSYFDQRGRPLRPVAVQVREVKSKGKAEALGLHARDVIVRYDGQHYTEVAKLVSAIKTREKAPGACGPEGRQRDFLPSDARIARCHARHVVHTLTPDSPSSDKPATKPAAPSFNDVSPGKKTLRLPSEAADLLRDGVCNY